MFYQPHIEIFACTYVPIEDWEHKNSFIPYWRFYWNDRKGASLLIGDTELQMEPDSFFLIPSETRFSSKSENFFNHFYVHFQAESPFDRVLKKIYQFQITPPLFAKIDALRELFAEQSTEQMKVNLLAYSLLYDALLMLKKENFSSKKDLDHRVEKTISYINKNTTKLLANEDLAAKVNMSTNSFIRLFTSETGSSPQNYSRKKRIEKASILLHFSDKSIDEIARETGFLDRYHFTRVFRDFTSRSPAEFRKERN